ncbi:MAG TPA: hypothetical protein VEY67_02955 [Candidatus Dormibacteraeota bacterium]|nr:hypothetical protein [Candidatus Dormibacteraeota bacterium]
MARSRATVVALLSLVALVAAACGGTPAASPIADPKEILVRAVEATQQAKTVHVKVEVTGSVPLGDLGGLFGGSGIPGASGVPNGASSQPSPAASGSAAGLKLDGTTAEGDVDLSKTAAHIGFSAPSLLGLTGDLIVVDRVGYLKVSMLGEKYQRLDQSSGAQASASPAASASGSGALDELRTQLDKLKTPPQKLADETCGDAQCYHVRVRLDQSDAAGLASIAPGVSGSGTVDVWVRTNDLRPARLVLTGDSGSAAGLSLTVTLSGWDAAVTVTAPPADQVTSGSGLFPSFAIPSFGASAAP